MQQQDKLRGGIVGISFLVALLGDLLFSGAAWGLNVGLWVATLLLMLVWLARRFNITLAGGGRWLATPALFFAAMFAWRDSATLVFLNGVALLVALGLLALRSREGRVRVAGVLEYLAGLLLVGVNTMFGSLSILREIPWGKGLNDRRAEQIEMVGRGLVVAIPLLLLFGSLFATADPIFAGFLLYLVEWDLETFFIHLSRIVISGLLIAGFYRHLFLWRGVAVTPPTRPSFLRIGRTETIVVLVSLNLLFLTFVLVQFRYLFGGPALVELHGELTYAEYARWGFFPLVLLTALVLPLLLLMHWLQKHHPMQVRAFRSLAGGLIALLFVIMLSTFRRMQIFYDAYGLTEERIYTTAFLGWLALTFLWFVATVLQGRRERFAFGTLVAAFAVLAFLNLLKPEALVIRTNINRANPAQPIGTYYVSYENADIVPDLVRLMPQVEADDRCRLAEEILDEWWPPATRDWRGWNWSRARAWSAVATSRGYLATSRGYRVTEDWSGVSLCRP